ncbi:carboxypeptidase M32 [Anaeromicropila herbilytica]|uniref:Metal-dependent carboxypeptidase n=1 Tax=Anaeromicropila herbilytica TaxID=2785025 RepID=A0A7R7IDS2_9FIRM|nr:carboxypeptidase M32 [Anaeromicropila herbilytica]BCN32013.1 carboxypeptidase 1 [Anaeromicropila herbilytica]
MSKTFELLQPYLDKDMALNTALTLLSWDMETLAPSGGMDYTAKAVGVLALESFNTLINEDVNSLLTKLETPDEQAGLDEVEKAIVKKLRKNYNDLKVIPAEEFKAYSELQATASNVWAQAKEKNDYNHFAPVLKKLIDFQRKFIGYRYQGEGNRYDVLLDDYEPGFTVEILDKFFNEVKETIIPLVQKVSANKDKVDNSFNYRTYNIEKQKEFCHFMAEYIGFDFNRGVIAESAHPFTTNLHNHDVRITNHFLENNLESAIFSVIHETGHALYEMQIDDRLTQTVLGSGTSMGAHESQSRFFENNIAKSTDFWLPVYPKLQEAFKEELKDVSLEDFIKGINQSTNSLIRTEADELTYCLHILIRYEIEKMMFNNEVEVEELPEIWNKKYEEYLGIRPETDSEGVLQDIHWACGNYGYFASYAIGSAVAAQIYAHMNKVMPVEQYLREGNLTPVREFLKENIHKYGMLKKTNELLKDMMGEELNAKYFTDYLTEKFTKLYELN